MVDNVVICNGIPKCGTYLLGQLVGSLDIWENANVHINPIFTLHRHSNSIGDVTKENINHTNSMRKMKRGEYACGHIPWSNKVEYIINRRNMKHLFIYRDPRDVYISYMNWVTYSKKYPEDEGSKEFQAFMKNNFSDDDERLSYVLNSNKHCRSHKGYDGWLDSDFCYAIRFEDLYPEILDLENNKVGAVVSKLFDYLGVDKDEYDMVDIYNKIYNKGHTSSDIREKVGQYKTVFKKEHYDIIDNEVFRKWLNKYGYEW